MKTSFLWVALAAVATASALDANPRDGKNGDASNSNNNLRVVAATADGRIKTLVVGAKRAHPDHRELQNNATDPNRTGKGGGIALGIAGILSALFGGGFLLSFLQFQACVDGISTQVGVINYLLTLLGLMTGSTPGPCTATSCPAGTFFDGTNCIATKSPTKRPTKSPTKSPTKRPTKRPTKAPTNTPVSGTVPTPTKAPVAPATKAPTTKAPATKAPITSAPATKAPTTKAPATKAPTGAPSAAPTGSSSPSAAPSAAPTTSAAPSGAPSAAPSLSSSPSAAPTTSAAPSGAPLAAPSGAPSAAPSSSSSPSSAPSAAPSRSSSPTAAPTFAPVGGPPCVPTPTTCCVDADCDGKEPFGGKCIGGTCQCDVANCYEEKTIQGERQCQLGCTTCPQQCSAGTAGTAGTCTTSTLVCTPCSSGCPPGTSCDGGYCVPSGICTARKNKLCDNAYSVVTGKTDNRAKCCPDTSGCVKGTLQLTTNSVCSTTCGGCLGELDTNYPKTFCSFAATTTSGLGVDLKLARCYEDITQPFCPSIDPGAANCPNSAKENAGCSPTGNNEVCCSATPTFQPLTCCPTPGSGCTPGR